MAQNVNTLFVSVEEGEFGKDFVRQKGVPQHHLEQHAAGRQNPDSRARQQVTINNFFTPINKLEKTSRHRAANITAWLPNHILD